MDPFSLDPFSPLDSRAFFFDLSVRDFSLEPPETGITLNPPLKLPGATESGAAGFPKQ